MKAGSSGTIAVLAAAALAAAVACTNTVIIYDYSGQGGKTKPDTVFVEKPGVSEQVPPGGSVPVPPPPGGGTAPVPPGTGPEEHGIEHPGRWSSVAQLVPGTARVETVISPIDSLLVYRVLGNVLDGRGGGSLEANPEVWRNTATGLEETYLTVVFPSHGTWQDLQGSPEVLRIEAGGEVAARLHLGGAVDVVPVPMGGGGYTVTMRFPVAVQLLRTLAASERVTMTLTDGDSTLQAVCSADNTQNFMTFYDVFVLEGGTKSMIPEGAVPAPAGPATATTGRPPRS